MRGLTFELRLRMSEGRLNLLRDRNVCLLEGSSAPERASVSSVAMSMDL